MNVGSVVKLKSGGPDMVVEKIHTDIEPMEVTCVFYSPGILGGGCIGVVHLRFL